MQQDCEITLVLARTTPDAARHARHSIILVPRNAPGLTVEGYDTIFGYDHAPYGHARLRFENVRVPVGNLLGREGEGFTLMQSGMGIGRIALAMGSIGAAERGLYEMCRWGDERVISGQKLVERQVFTDAVARSRMEIEQCRAYVLRTAWMIEKLGMKAVRSEVAQCKVLAPNMALAVLDRAIQFLGGLGVSHDRPLAEMYAYQRTVRIERARTRSIATWSRGSSLTTARTARRASAVSAWSGSKGVETMSGRAVRICSAGCRAGVARPGPRARRRHLCGLPRRRPVHGPTTPAPTCRRRSARKGRSTDT
jgi:alkylation response protein AidB-like acyl-CoA dehydrogenase